MKYVALITLSLLWIPSFSHAQKQNARQRYSCTHCHKDFSTPGNRTQHWNSKHHPNPTKPPCPKCGKLFVKPSGVHEHVRRVHYKKPYVKKFPCNKCGKGFTKRFNATRHSLRCTVVVRAAAVVIENISPPTPTPEPFHSMKTRSSPAAATAQRAPQRCSSPSILPLYHSYHDTEPPQEEGNDSDSPCELSPLAFPDDPPDHNSQYGALPPW